MKNIPTLNDAGVIDGIMMWITVAIMLIVFLPVLNSILSSVPAIAVNNTLNATQTSMTTMVASSYGLLIVTLIVIAAVVILGVVAYLRTGGQQR